MQTSNNANMPHFGATTASSNNIKFGRIAPPLPPAGLAKNVAMGGAALLGGKFAIDYFSPPVLKGVNKAELAKTASSLKTFAATSAILTTAFGGVLILGRGATEKTIEGAVEKRSNKLAESKKTQSSSIADSPVNAMPDPEPSEYSVAMTKEAAKAQKRGAKRAVKGDDAKVGMSKKQAYNVGKYRVPNTSSANDWQGLIGDSGDFKDPQALAGLMREWEKNGEQLTPDRIHPAYKYLADQIARLNANTKKYQKMGMTEPTLSIEYHNRKNRAKSLIQDKSWNSSTPYIRVQGSRLGIETDFLIPVPVDTDGTPLLGRALAHSSADKKDGLFPLATWEQMLIGELPNKLTSDALPDLYARRDALRGKEPRVNQDGSQPTNPYKEYGTAQEMPNYEAQIMARIASLEGFKPEVDADGTVKFEISNDTYTWPQYANGKNVPLPKDVSYLTKTKWQIKQPLKNLPGQAKNAPNSVSKDNVQFLQVLVADNAEKRLEHLASYGRDSNNSPAFEKCKTIALELLAKDDNVRTELSKDNNSNYILTLKSGNAEFSETYKPEMTGTTPTPVLGSSASKLPSKNEPIKKAALEYLKKKAKPTGDDFADLAAMKTQLELTSAEEDEALKALVEKQPDEFEYKIDHSGKIYYYNKGVDTLTATPIYTKSLDATQNPYNEAQKSGLVSNKALLDSLQPNASAVQVDVGKRTVTIQGSELDTPMTLPIPDDCYKSGKLDYLALQNKVKKLKELNYSSDDLTGNVSWAVWQMSKDLRENNKSLVQLVNDVSKSGSELSDLDKGRLVALVSRLRVPGGLSKSSDYKLQPYAVKSTKSGSLEAGVELVHNAGGKFPTVRLSDVDHIIELTQSTPSGLPPVLPPDELKTLLRSLQKETLVRGDKAMKSKIKKQLDAL